MTLIRLRFGVLALLAIAGLSSCAAPPDSDPAPTLPRSSPATPSWAPWPSSLHDARHSGSSTTDGPTRGTARWRRQLEGAVTPGPVVGADGTIYLASNGGVLHAMNPADGADRWTYDSGTQSSGDLSVSPLVLPNGTVLFPTTDRIIALTPEGKTVWSEPFPGVPTSPVTVDGQRVYVGETSGTVTALDIAAPAERRIAWRTHVGMTSYGSVVTDGKGRIYTTADTALVAIDDQGTSAKIAWQSDPHDDITEVSAGLAPDGTVLLGTNGHTEWAYRPDGTALWKTPSVITYSSPVITATGLAYLADHSGQVRALDIRTGNEIARYGPIDAQIWSSVIVDRAYRVYFAGQNGHVYGYDGTGARLFDMDLGGPIDSYPALTADGALVIGSRDGFVTAIG